jgi:hypothetical protein
MWWFSQVPNLVLFGGVVGGGGLSLDGDGGVAHHLRSITRAVLDCLGLGWLQGDSVFHAGAEFGDFPGAEFGDFWRGGRAVFPLLKSEGGGAGHHLRIITRAKSIVSSAELVVMLGFGIDRINAIAGALIFAVSEVGVRNPSVSGGFVQLSPGEDAHQHCLGIGSAAQEQGAKSRFRVHCPCLGFDA